jgi:hypothetical protein
MSVDTVEAAGIAGIALASIGGFVRMLSRVLSVVDRNTAAFVDLKNTMATHGRNLEENTKVTRELKDSVREMKQSQDQFSRSLIDAFGRHR